MPDYGSLLPRYQSRSMRREECVIACALLLGSTGAIPAATLTYAKRCGFSIARNSAGNYTVTFGRKWKQLKSFSLVSAQAVSGATGQVPLITTAYSATAGTFTFQLLDGAHAAAEAANAATLHIEMIVSPLPQSDEG